MPTGGVVAMSTTPRPLIKQARLRGLYAAEKVLINALAVYEEIQKSIVNDLNHGTSVEPGVCEIIADHRRGRVRVEVRKRG